MNYFFTLHNAFDISLSVLEPSVKIQIFDMATYKALKYVSKGSQVLFSIFGSRKTSYYCLHFYCVLLCCSSLFLVSMFLWILYPNKQFGNPTAHLKTPIQKLLDVVSKICDSFKPFVWGVFFIQRHSEMNFS